MERPKMRLPFGACVPCHAMGRTYRTLSSLVIGWPQLGLSLGAKRGVGTLEWQHFPAVDHKARKASWLTSLGRGL